jgi:hypothetical protein
LARSLGEPALFAAAYGNVGSDIYFALGLVALFALGLTPVVFLIAGLLFVTTALSYAEAATSCPKPVGARRLLVSPSTTWLASWQTGPFRSTTFSRRRSARCSFPTTSRRWGCPGSSTRRATGWRELLFWAFSSSST